MQHSDSSSDAPYGDASGTVRPFLAGLSVFAAFDAVRGDDGVWEVVIGPESGDIAQVATKYWKTHDR